MCYNTVVDVEKGIGMGIISVEKSRSENSESRKSISVESQPKLMPIATIDRIILTDTRRI